MCSKSGIQFFIGLALQAKSHRSSSIKDLPNSVIKQLDISISGVPKDKLVSKIEEEVSFLERFGLIEKYADNKRCRLLADITNEKMSAAE